MLKRNILYSPFFFCKCFTSLDSLDLRIETLGWILFPNNGSTFLTKLPDSQYTNSMHYEGPSTGKPGLILIFCRAEGTIKDINLYFLSNLPVTFWILSPGLGKFCKALKKSQMLLTIIALQKTLLAFQWLKAILEKNGKIPVKWRSITPKCY